VARGLAMTTAVPFADYQHQLAAAGEARIAAEQSAMAARAFAYALAYLADPDPGSPQAVALHAAYAFDSSAGLAAAVLAANPGWTGGGFVHWWERP